MCLSGVFGISCLLIKQIPLVREYMGTYIYSIVELGIKLPLGIAFSIALLQSPAIIKIVHYCLYVDYAVLNCILYICKYECL